MIWTDEHHGGLAVHKKNAPWFFYTPLHQPIFTCTFPHFNINKVKLYSNNRKIVTDILLNYSNTFGESHRIDAMGGYTANKSDYFNVNTYVQNYDIQSLGINNIGLGAAASTPQSHANAWALQSYLGRAFYSFQDKYSITASLRADGTSRVSPDNAWGLFPSAAVSWRITEESFMQSVDWLAQLKLRVSYGVTGNQNIPPYQFYSSYSAQQTVIDNQLVPSS